MGYGLSSNRASLRPSRRVGRWAVTCLAASLALAGSAAAAAKPKPDFAIDPSSIKFTKAAFQGESGTQIRFCERTTNRGIARAPRRLHNQMILVAPNGIGVVVVTRDAPRLPGRSRATARGPWRYTSHYGCATGDAAPVTLPTGAYDVRICADLRIVDRTRANNCVRFRKAFVVAKRTWTAVMTGSTRTVVLDQESWQANGAAMVFTHRDAQGRFVYRLATGSVSYKYAQTIATGCNRNGAGTDFGPTVELVLDYVGEGYTALGRKSEAFNYAIPSLCENDTRQGPTLPIFLDTGIGVAQQPLPFGSDQIAGTRIEGDDRFDWIFR